MSDTTSAYPPPPPPDVQPPTYQAPAYAPPPATVLPNYQPPPMSQPPAGYSMQAPYPQWQQPQAGIGAGMGAVGILSQFSGSALWGCILGVATIVAPFVFGYVFFFLPIVGLLAGFRAIRAGKPIAGTVAIVLNAIGGLITVASLVIR